MPRTLALFSVSIIAFAVLAFFADYAPAQFGISLPSIGDVTGEKAEPTPAAPANAGGQTLAQPTTFTNTARNFTFTIPAGWSQQSGNPATEEGVIFMKPGTSLSFQYHMTQMTPSFPAAASVQASIQQNQEMQQIGKLESVKRRDDSDKKNDRSLNVIGWEIVQAPKGADGGIQRIIWQAYDQDNYYYNFMAAGEPSAFAANQAELQSIIDSIKFKLP